MVWARSSGERSREYSPGGLVQGFLEPQARSFAPGLSADLHLVSNRADDRNPETAFGELIGTALGCRGIEALALVGDLDDEPVGVELVRDLDDAGVVALCVRVPDRVGRGLGQC